MKYILVFISISLLLANSLVKLSQVVHFTLNQEKIAKELCVERNVENSCCAGKCHLAKSVKAVERDFSDPVEGVVVLEVFDPFYLLVETLPNFMLNGGLGVLNSKPTNFVDLQFVNQIFHPPIV